MEVVGPLGTSIALNECISAVGFGGVILKLMNLLWCYYVATESNGLYMAHPYSLKWIPMYWPSQKVIAPL